MTTAYDLIFDLFLQSIKDWKLDALYTSSVPNFETYLKGFLVLSIPEFEVFCDQSLARNDTTNLFTENLTDKNKQMLAQMMVEKWMNKEVQDIRQIKLHVDDKDFRVKSEALNLKAKESYLIFIREKIAQSLAEYAWYGFDMTNWISGNFLGV